MTVDFLTDKDIQTLQNATRDHSATAMNTLALLEIAATLQRSNELLAEMRDLMQKLVPNG